MIVENYTHETSAAELYRPIQDEILAIRESWQHKTLADIRAEMPEAEYVGMYDGRSMRAVVLDPEGERDEQTTDALILPHQQDWTPHHYVRARIKQQLLAPNSRWVVLLNKNAHTFLPEEQKQLARGDGKPQAEQQMQALEQFSVGATMLDGYSKGGLDALHVAALGSDKIEIVAVNADEVPSKVGRNTKELRRDFMASGGPLTLRKVIRSADILALSEAMSDPRLLADMGKFAVASFKKENQLMEETMTGSADMLMRAAARQLPDGAAKVGFIEGSKLFDPQSLSPSVFRIIRLVKYYGPGFARHASGDNPILNAAMSHDGLVLPRKA